MEGRCIGLGITDGVRKGEISLSEEKKKPKARKLLIARSRNAEIYLCYQPPETKKGDQVHRSC